MTGWNVGKTGEKEAFTGRSGMNPFLFSVQDELSPGPLRNNATICPVTAGSLFISPAEMRKLIQRMYFLYGLPEPNPYLMN